MGYQKVSAARLWWSARLQDQDRELLEYIFNSDQRSKTCFARPRHPQQH
jgi:hypothetical protein